MVVRKVKRVVGLTARAAKKTAGRVRSELVRLERAGVLSKDDLRKLFGLLTHEVEEGKERLVKFVKSEVKHDVALAKVLGRKALARTRKVSKVLREKKHKKTLRKRSH